MKAQSTNSSINPTGSLNTFSWLRVAFVVATLVNFALFRWIGLQEAKNVTAAVESVLRHEYSTASTYQLSRSLADLEKLESLSCIGLWESSVSKRLFYDTTTNPKCVLPFGIEKLRRNEAVLKAANGLDYVLQFQIPIRLQTLALEALGYLLILVMGMLLKRSVEKKEIESKAREELAYQALQFAHDIRSPLAALEIVSQSNHGLSDEERSLVNSAAVNIRSIADDLLAQGKGNSTKGRKEAISSSSVREIIESAISEKRTQFRHLSAIAFEYLDRNPSLPALAKMDPLKLRRIISNLLNNAVEAMQSGIVKVHLELNENQIVISISDTGIGMSAETLAQVGKRGFSLKGSDGFSGAGIGVFYTRTCVEEAGGQLEIQSTLGQGSTFLLYLPLESSQVACPAGTSAVLLDNDPTMGVVWNLAAKRAGVSLQTFTTAHELTKALQKLNKDTAVYLDLNLGEGQVRGVDLAHDLSNAGYKNITLTTGESAELYANLPWIKEVIGKTPPWIQA